LISSCSGTLLCQEYILSIMFADLHFLIRHLPRRRLHRQLPRLRTRRGPQLRRGNETSHDPLARAERRQQGMNEKIPVTRTTELLLTVKVRLTTRKGRRGSRRNITSSCRCPPFLSRMKVLASGQIVESDRPTP
jgi:hypothetical protein